MVHQRTDGVGDRALLPSSWGGSGYENTGVFAMVKTRGPLLAGRIPEGFELSREVTVTGGDAEEEGVVLLKYLGGYEWDCVGLAGSMHFLENFGREGFFDSRGRYCQPMAISPSLGERGLSLLIKVGFSARGFNASFLSFGQLMDVAIHGVLHSIAISS